MNISIITDLSRYLDTKLDTIGYVLQLVNKTEEGDAYALPSEVIKLYMCFGIKPYIVKNIEQNNNTGVIFVYGVQNIQEKYWKKNKCIQHLEKDHSQGSS